MNCLFKLSILVSFITSLADLFPNALYNEASIYDFIDDDLFFEIIYPESLRYTYRLKQAKDFGTSFMYPLKGQRLVVADPEHCCTSLYNGPDMLGAVALVTRGSCSFVSKALCAETAGAIAIIVSDADVSNDDTYIEMIGDGSQREPNIPAFFLLGKNGHMIRKALVGDQSDWDSAAIINIPVNLTNVPIGQLNQPPWIIW